MLGFGVVSTAFCSLSCLLFLFFAGVWGGGVWGRFQCRSPRPAFTVCTASLDAGVRSCWVKCQIARTRGASLSQAVRRRTHTHRSHIRETANCLPCLRCGGAWVVLLRKLRLTVPLWDTVELNAARSKRGSGLRGCIRRWCDAHENGGFRGVVVSRPFVWRKDSAEEHCRSSGR